MRLDARKRMFYLAALAIQKASLRISSSPSSLQSIASNLQSIASSSLQSIASSSLQSIASSLRISSSPSSLQSIASSLLLLAGCTLDPLPQTADCANLRKDALGQCCPHWSTPDKNGLCADRTWVLPLPSHGLPTDPAYRVRLTMDDRDRILASFEVSSEANIQVAVAEEMSIGSFSIRMPAANLSGPARSAFPAAGQDGSAMVAWVQGEADAYIATTERDPAGSWQDPQSSDMRWSFPPVAYEPKIATNAQDEWILLWNQWMSTGYGVALARRANFNAPWQLPLDADDVLSPHILYTNTPQIALNDAGDAVITWYQSPGGPLMIYASERRTPSDPFSRPDADAFISAPGAPVDSHPVANPMPAISHSGQAAIVWTQENGKGSSPVYLALRDPNGVWTLPQSLDDAFSRPVGIARCAQVAFTGDEDLYIVWYQDEGTGNRVLAAHRTAQGQWTLPGTQPAVLSTPGVTAITPALTTTDHGEALVVWSEQGQDGSFRIAARRAPFQADPFGPIEVLSYGPGDATEPAVAISHATGRVAVAWLQGLPAQNQVFIARME